MTSSEQLIRTWRRDHPGEHPTARTLKDALGVGDLCMADLSRTNLSDADLSGENLYAANFSGANACRADFSGANLGYTNFSGTYLRWASLRRTRPRGANFSNAYLSDADLYGLDLSRSRLRGAMLPGILTIEGTSRGDAQLVPTPAGWHLRFGGWSGLLDEFTGQVAKESADLSPIIELCRDHVARHRSLDNGFPHTRLARRSPRLAGAIA